VAEDRKGDTTIMKKSYEEVFNMLLERTADNTELLRKSNRQRRNGMEDLYGVMFSKDSVLDPDDGKYVAKFYVSLSPDYVYLSRFAFKLVIERKEGDVPPSGDEEAWEFFVDGVDVTDYLMEQHDGAWIDGAGIYPTRDLDEVIEEDDNEPNFYDILDVASLMQTEIDEEDDDTRREQLMREQKKVLRRGFKPVEIKSEAPFHCDAYLYCKYSHLNR